MNDDTCKLFASVAEKLGWADEGGLDTAEKKVCCSIHKLPNSTTLPPSIFLVLGNTSILFKY